MNLTTTPRPVHKFEEAGLGKAPFRIVGVEERRGPIKFIDPATGVECEAGAPGQPMGTCAYCAQGIAECWMIKSADGRHFVVGCECVRKTGDSGLRRVVNKHRSETRKKREAERITAARDRLTNDKMLRRILAGMPSPNERRAEVHGERASDWCDWMFKNGGVAGRMRVVRYLDNLEKGE